MVAISFLSPSLIDAFLLTTAAIPFLFPSHIPGPATASDLRLDAVVREFMGAASGVTNDHVNSSRLTDIMRDVIRSTEGRDESKPGKTNKEAPQVSLDELLQRPYRPYEIEDMCVLSIVIGAWTTSSSSAPSYFCLYPLFVQRLVRSAQRRGLVDALAGQRRRRARRRDRGAAQEARREEQEEEAEEEGGGRGSRLGGARCRLNVMCTLSNATYVYNHP